MAEPVTFSILNKRMAELLHECELHKNRSRRAILEEISELNVLRDELRKIQQKAGDRTKQLSRSSAQEFPTIGALIHQLHTIVREIAKTPRDNPHRAELLNEVTRLSLMADFLFDEH